jgi:hypothetical protein
LVFAPDGCGCDLNFSFPLIKPNLIILGHFLQT